MGKRFGVREMITEEGFLMAMAVVGIFVLILIVANLCEKQERELKECSSRSMTTRPEDEKR